MDLDEALPFEFLQHRDSLPAHHPAKTKSPGPRAGVNGVTDKWSRPEVRRDVYGKVIPNFEKRAVGTWNAGGAKYDQEIAE